MPVSLQSTIVAQNNSANQVGRDLLSATKLATFTIQNCLIGDPSSAYLNPIGFNLLGVDPLLAPLAWNGGPTQTHALLAGSPTINNGSNPLGLLTDQRGPGYKRVKGDFADIGAFEL